MFCKKCGNEIKDGEKFCAVCGTPVETAPMQSVQTQHASEGAAKANMEKVTEAASQAAESVVKKAQEIGEKGKDAWKKASQDGSVLKKLLNGKNKVWLIVCAAVFVVLIPCIANAARINNSFHKTFSSPEKYFQFVAKKELNEVTDLMGGYYSDIISRTQFYDKSYSGEFTLEPGDGIQKLVKLADAFLNLDYMGIDLSELKSLKLGANVSIKDSVVGYGLTTAVNKVDLLSINAVMNMDQGELYLQIPELTKTYLGVEMGDYIGDTDAILERQEANKELIKSLPKQAEVEKLMSRYLTIVLKNIDNVSIGRKKELKVEGITQKCTELKVTIDGETMQNILEAVLEEALDDRSLEKIIVAVADGYDLDGDEIYEEFIEGIEHMLDNIEYLADDDMEIKVNVYVDSKGGIIGIVIEQEDYWGESAFNVLTARKGNAVGYEISTVQYGRDVLEISGKGKKSGNQLTGDFQVEYWGESVMELKVMGLDMEKLKRGYVNGKTEITLSSKICDEIGVSAISSLAKKSSLLLDCKSSSDSLDYKFTLNYDGDKILSAEMALKSGNGSKASIPGGKSVIMIEDADDFMDYYDEINWDKFLKGLEKTGVLSELAEELEDVIDDLDDLIGAMYSLKYLGIYREPTVPQMISPEYIEIPK